MPRRVFLHQLQGGELGGAGDHDHGERQRFVSVSPASVATTPNSMREGNTTSMKGPVAQPSAIS